MNDTGTLFQVEFDDKQAKICLSRIEADGSVSFRYYLSYELIEKMDVASASRFLGERILLLSEHFRKHFKDDLDRNL